MGCCGPLAECLGSQSKQALSPWLKNIDAGTIEDTEDGTFVIK
jgi:hypothetical protein